jgi:hypothetical protein
MTKPSTCAGTLFVNVSMPFAGMRLVPDSCYFGYRVIRCNGHLGQPHRRDGFDRHAFAQKPWERLDANNLGVAWRAMSRLMLKSAKRASLVENLRSLRGLDKVRVR